MMPRVIVGLLALAIALVAFPSYAGPQEDAGKLFDKGLLLYKKKKFLEAADSFHEAYKLFPHGDSLFNAGMAWEGAGMRAVAATAYVQALEEGIREKAEQKARSNLATLEKRLARIEVMMPPGSSVHVDVLELKGERVVIYVEPGSQTLIVTLESGERVSRQIDAVPGDSLKVAIDPPKPPPPPPKPAPPPKESKGDTWRTVGYVSLGVAGVATGAAIIFGLNAWSARDDFKDSGQTDRSARDRAVSNMHLTNVCWGIAAVTAAGGGVLLLYVAPKMEASSKEKSGAITVLGRF